MADLQSDKTAKEDAGAVAVVNCGKCHVRRFQLALGTGRLETVWGLDGGKQQSLDVTTWGLKCCATWLFTELPNVLLGWRGIGNTCHPP